MSKEMTREEAFRLAMRACEETWNEKICKQIKGALEQEPFMNKPCVAHQVCHEDKVKTLDNIRTEIEQIEINGHIRDVECFNAGINTVLNIIEKYKAESEG